jgi:Histidine phosphatase superfamily (branch 2)
MENLQSDVSYLLWTDRRVLEAVNEAFVEGVDEPEKLNLLKEVLTKKMTFSGTKVQIKPNFKNGTLEKLQLILKWGGEFTHSALHQSKYLGENMRKEIILINKECLDDVKVFTASERRVSASGTPIPDISDVQLRFLRAPFWVRRNYQKVTCMLASIFSTTQTLQKI